MTIVIEEVASNKPGTKPIIRLILDKNEHQPIIEAVRDLIAKAAVTIPDDVEKIETVRLKTKD